MIRSSPNSRIRRILAVGRDVSQLSSGANLLTQAGYSTDLVVTAEQAIQRANVGRYHLAIVSSTFPYDDQLSVCARLKQARPSLPVLLLGPEHDSPETFLESVAASFGRQKSFDIEPHLTEGLPNDLADS